MGAGLGQLALGNPVASIGLIIGLAMLAVGLSAGLIKCLITMERNAGNKKLCTQAEERLHKQLFELPEALLTGFLFGLMFGGIQQADYKKHLPEIEKNKYAYAKQHTNLRITDVQVDGHTMTIQSRGMLYPNGMRAVIRTDWVTIPGTAPPFVENGAFAAMTAQIGLDAALPATAAK